MGDNDDMGMVRGIFRIAANALLIAFGLGIILAFVAIFCGRV